MFKVQPDKDPPPFHMFSFPGTASGMLQQSKQAANMSLQLTHTMKYYYSIGKLPFEECPTYSLASASAFHSSLEFFQNSLAEAGGKLDN